MEGLKALIDELVDCANNARSCLSKGKIFFDEKTDDESRKAAYTEYSKHHPEGI